MEVTFSGTNLADARELLFDEPGFKVELSPKPAANAVKAKVKVASDVRLGEHSFRVITASGVSDVRLFYVTPFPTVAEAAESKDKSNAPQPVSLGTTVYGRTPDDDQDKYEVELKKGQRLSIEVIGTRQHTHTLYDPALSIAWPLYGGPLLSAKDQAALPLAECEVFA